MEFHRLICVFVFILGYCSLQSQQNLFNVPSSDITVKKKIFFQQQLNITETIQSNTNFCYGLGNGMEIGANVIGLQTDGRRFYTNEDLGNGSISPLLLSTFQKAFHITKHTFLGIGTELGTNLIKSEVKNSFLANFTYLNSKTELLNDKLKIIGGVYYSNTAYNGVNSTIGIMMGYEYSLSKKIHFVGDWTSGDNYIGVGVLGGMYYVTKDFPISLGLQIPNNSEKNQYGAVLEFTYVPND